MTGKVLLAAACLGAMLVLLGGAPARSSVLRPGSTPARPELTLHGPRFGAPRARGAASVPATSMDAEVARLAQRAPARIERVRDQFRQAEDLHEFVAALLPDAEAGERVANFYVYLGVGQCQMYLRLDAEEARALNERMLLQLDDRPVEERRQWESEYRRCRNFAGADPSALKRAMGDDMPGSENEYASIFYQRAASAGYPPALAEGALRISTLDASERLAMLEEAAASGDPEVYFMLFFHSAAPDDAIVTPRGMAWLLAACRAGYDCTPDADWFRNNACLQDGDRCGLDESAIEHYWYRLSLAEREQAWALADRIAAGANDEMPWPSLIGRNLFDRRDVAGEDANPSS